MVGLRYEGEDDEWPSMRDVLDKSLWSIHHSYRCALFASGEDGTFSARQAYRALHHWFGESLDAGKREQFEDALVEIGASVHLIHVPAPTARVYDRPVPAVVLGGFHHACYVDREAESVAEVEITPDGRWIDFACGVFQHVAAGLSQYAGNTGQAV
jgi:hypothetical protein